MSSNAHWETLGPPPLGLFALEQGRTLLDLASLRSRRRALAGAAPGDGHPVLVLPGLFAGDFSTAPLRGFLHQLRYDAHRWGLGLNLGPSAELGQKLEALRAGCASATGGASAWWAGASAASTRASWRAPTPRTCAWW